MNRRSAISRILFAGGAGVLALTGWNAYTLFRKPDLLFLKENKLLIDELAETIIPATDTPGAKEAGVGDFILRMMRDCTSVKTQNNFIEGLHDLMGYCGKKYDKTYFQCSAKEKTETLLHFENTGTPYKGTLGKVERKILGDSFFTTLKNYTVIGYCTSEAGATKGLSYDYIPGKYVGIVPITPGQKAWATQ